MSKPNVSVNEHFLVYNHSLSHSVASDKPTLVEEMRRLMKLMTKASLNRGKKRTICPTKRYGFPGGSTTEDEPYLKCNRTDKFDENSSLDLPVSLLVNIDREEPFEQPTAVFSKERFSLNKMTSKFHIQPICNNS